MKYGLYVIGTLGILAALTTVVFYRTEPSQTTLGAANLNSQQLANKLAEIDLEQAKYASTSYVQVLKNGVYPEYESRRLNVTIPQGMRIDVYNGLQGRGFDVIYETDTVFIKRSFGPENRENFRCDKLTPTTTTPSNFVNCVSL